MCAAFDRARLKPCQYITMKVMFELMIEKLFWKQISDKYNIKLSVTFCYNNKIASLLKCVLSTFLMYFYKKSYFR
jgi:hypothetical protein